MGNLTYVSFRLPFARLLSSGTLIQCLDDNTLPASTVLEIVEPCDDGLVVKIIPTGERVVLSNDLELFDFAPQEYEKTR